MQIDGILKMPFFKWSVRVVCTALLCSKYITIFLIVDTCVRKPCQSNFPLVILSRMIGGFDGGLRELSSFSFLSFLQRRRISHAPIIQEEIKCRQSQNFDRTTWKKGPQFAVYYISGDYVFQSKQTVPRFSKPNYKILGR